MKERKPVNMDNVVITKPHEAAATLAQIADQINGAHDGVEAATRDAVGHARRAGELLLQVKARLPHGQWGPWLDAHFKGSHETAERYMRIAKHWDVVVAQGGRELGIRRALKLIAQDKDAPEGPKASLVTDLPLATEDLDHAGETAPEPKGRGTMSPVEDAVTAQPASAKEKAATTIISGEKDAPQKPVAGGPRKVYDGTGNLVTDPRYNEVFADREEFVELFAIAKKLRERVRQLVERAGGATIHKDSALASFGVVLQELEVRVPHVVCTVCNGNKLVIGNEKKACEACGGAGWLDVFLHGLVATNPKRRKS